MYIYAKRDVHLRKTGCTSKPNGMYICAKLHVHIIQIVL